MMVNKHNAWNMSLDVSGITLEKVDNLNWRVYIAKLMLNCIDQMDKTIVLPVCEHI